MTLAPELQAALEALLDELDRLMLLGDQGRRRRGVTTLSVESIRYLRLGVAQVLAGEARRESLQGAAAAVAEGVAPTAALLSAVQRVEALV